MNQEIKNALYQVYNGLSTIFTRGEDSVTMVKCLQILTHTLNLIECTNLENKEEK